MKAHDYQNLISALNQAVDILDRNRTPDPRFIAAYDTLKVARAKIERTVASAPADTVPFSLELAAA